MGNRRESSSNYPKKPHNNKKNRSGEWRKDRSKGLFDRDGEKSANVRRRRGLQGRAQGSNVPRGKQTRKTDLPPLSSPNQITDGRYRGHELKVSASPKMRPTPPNLRETLFRILFRKIRSRRFLDLCAGAGTVGIGAISRGALISTMVERGARNISLIRENLKDIGISEGHGEVFQLEFESFLKKMAKKRRFWDVVYFGPPYDCDYDEAFSILERGWGIEKGGILVVEHPSELFLPERQGCLKRWKVVLDGEDALSFFDRVN